MASQEQALPQFSSLQELIPTRKCGVEARMLPSKESIIERRPWLSVCAFSPHISSKLSFAKACWHLSEVCLGSTNTFPELFHTADHPQEETLLARKVAEMAHF